MNLKKVNICEDWRLVFQIWGEKARVGLDRVGDDPHWQIEGRVVGVRGGAWGLGGPGQLLESW